MDCECCKSKLKLKSYYCVWCDSLICPNCLDLDIKYIGTEFNCKNCVIKSKLIKPIKLN